MTSAEPQARFREQHAGGQPKVRFRSPADRRSRAQRWRDAVAELVSLQEDLDYRAWLDALPGNLTNSSTAEALRTVCDIDLSELESVEPPRLPEGLQWCPSECCQKASGELRSASALTAGQTAEEYEPEGKVTNAG